METNNDNGFWVWFINAATIVAAAMLYFKTSEVMTAIAPLTLLGYTGLQVLYGIVTAGLVEGVTLALHFVPRFKGNQSATAYKVFLFIVSGFCQFMDKSMVVNAGKATSELGAFFQWIALAIPLAVFGGLLLVGNATKGTSVGKSSRPFKGIVPAFREVLYGQGSVGKSETLVLAKTTDEEVLANPDESVGRSANPSTGKVRAK